MSLLSSISERQLTSINNLLQKSVVQIQVTELGDEFAAETIPISSEKVRSEYADLDTVLTSSGSITVTGTPPIKQGTILSKDNRYYEISISRDDVTETTVPVLKAERVRKGDVTGTVVSGIDSFDDEVQRYFQNAIGKARHLKNQREEKIDMESNSEDLNVQQQGYVFDSGRLPTEHSQDFSEPIVVRENGEQYRLLIEDEIAKVNRYNLEFMEVATDRESFEEWFEKEHIDINTENKKLSTDEHQILQRALEGEYMHVEPYDESIKSLLSQLDYPTSSTSQAQRFARVNNELLEITITGTVGC
ncbi:hypothetical protein ACLI4Z_07090 [Natrialbaceae archaeon A-arb3/5]